MGFEALSNCLFLTTKENIIFNMPNIIITGATHGIGKEIVSLFYSKGYDVAFCARNKDDLESLAKELSKSDTKGTIFYESRDLSIKKEVLDFANSVIEEFDTIDILVNNAGIFYPGSIEKEEDGALEYMINTNLLSAYHLTRSLLPRIHSSKKGHIFNMCSTASKMAYPNGGSYGITKHALLGFSKVLREELKESGIKVSSVLPGPTYSRSWEGSGIEKERFMKAEDIAQMIYTSYNLSANAVVEEITMRPILGDL